MPTTQNGIARFDINDPEDVQRLVNTGLAWRSGPKSLQAIIRLIAGGQVQRRPDKEPPEVRTYLDKVAPEAPVEEPIVEPVEPPVNDGA